MNEVILAEDYQNGNAVLHSISNRTICEDLEDTGGMEARVRTRKVSLLGW